MRIVLVLISFLAAVGHAAAQPGNAAPQPYPAPAPLPPASGGGRLMLELGVGLGRLYAANGGGRSDTGFFGPSVSIGVRTSRFALAARFARASAPIYDDVNGTVTTLGPMFRLWIVRPVWIEAGPTLSWAGDDVPHNESLRGSGFGGRIGGSVPVSGELALNVSFEVTAAIGIYAGEVLAGWATAGVLVGIQWSK